MERKRLSPTKSLLINVALLVSSFACCLGGLEGVGWAWERAQAQGEYAWELVASRRIRLDHFETPGAGYYTLSHPGDTYNWQGIPVEINSRGLRGPDIDVEKPSDTYRILILGDSVVFGWGVRYEEIYGHRLNEMLSEGSEGRGTAYQVINAGVPGWNVENALAYLQAEGLAYRPDLIVLNFTIVNDVYGRGAVPTRDRPFYEWVRDRSYFWSFLSTQYHLLKVRMGRESAIPVLSPSRAAASYFPLSEDDAQWDVVWEPIREIAVLAGEHKADFLLVVLPTAFQVQDAAYPDVPQRVFGKRGVADQIKVLDLLPAFQEACREALPKEGCMPEDRYLWADMWMHPSALGHRLIAEQIMNLLNEGQRH